MQNFITVCFGKDNSPQNNPFFGAITVLYQKIQLFLLRKFSRPFLFSHYYLDTKKRKLFWLVRGCSSILIGRPIDFHISMGISNSQILIRLTPLWPSNQNTSPGHLRTWIWFFFFTRIFGWVIIMTHLNAYFLSTKTAEWIHFIQKQFKMIEK